ncbi:AraC family transcriptional regulator [Enterococcus sp. BWT-B8]|uniref:AraC family transcriptional regulator n=1 Tax=Enterococcus sp. BWT-B8 TaxID=2885157 RepID=UPI001E52D239|nr:AraC family transcriptional regulator [Enterococcus sp. BWT-B8]MCB5952214.1 AraC family transcriptional regulator [Enterococcus sp. BWT-B8]
MEWIDRLEQSLDYIEKNLTEKIDYSELAKIACCSEYHYQRVFSYIVGVPLTEYIRRRRLSLAGAELQQGDKVLTVAVKYGYESANSFTRAFKAIHGITPSQAKKEGVRLKNYPRIKFQISIKGDVEMEYRIETKEAFRIVGARTPLSKEIEENFKEVPQFWSKVSTDGTLSKIVPLMNQKLKGVMGVSSGFAANEDEPEYYIAVASDQPVPEGLAEYTVKRYTWAIFSGSGPMPHAIQELEKRIVTDWLPSSGYEYTNGPDIELYIESNPENAVFEVWMPVVKAKENTED